MGAGDTSKGPVHRDRNGLPRGMCRNREAAPSSLGACERHLVECSVSTMTSVGAAWSRCGTWRLPPEGKGGDGNLPLPHISRPFSLSSGLGFDIHLSGKPSLTPKPQ